MEKTIPPEKVDTNPKEKMKQMRLPFAPIQKENAITKQKEEQEKERQRIAIEKQLKLEAEKAAQKELDAINQRECKKEQIEKENQVHAGIDTVSDQTERKRKLSETAASISSLNKKSNLECERKLTTNLPDTLTKENIVISKEVSKPYTKIKIAAKGKHKTSQNANDLSNECKNKRNKEEDGEEDIFNDLEVEKMDIAEDISNYSNSSCYDDVISKDVSVSTSPENNQSPLISDVQKSSINDICVTPQSKSMLQNCNENKPCSPAVFEDRKHRLKVEIAKLVVKINELKDALEKSIEKQEFLVAQEIKTTITSVESEKTTLSLILQKENASEMKDALESRYKKIATTKLSLSSPLSEPRSKTVAAEVLSTVCKQDNTGEAQKEPEVDSKVPPKKLTPKRIDKMKDKEERAKIREEEKTAKEKERRQKEEEKEKERIERNIQKEKERKEKEELKEKEKKEKEEIREREKKEKEQQKERERIEKLEQKQKERLEKEKLRLAKEEEKVKKQLDKELEKEELRKEREQEKIKKEQEKERLKKEKEEERERQERLENQRQAKEAKLFTSFFTKKPQNNDNETNEELNNPGACGVLKQTPDADGMNRMNFDSTCRRNNNLSQFLIKKNMRIAPSSRSTMELQCRNKIDHILKTSKWEDTISTYLNVLKHGSYKASKSGHTWPAQDLGKQQGNIEDGNDGNDGQNNEEEEEDYDEDQTVASLLGLDQSKIVEIDIPDETLTKDMNMKNKSSGGIGGDESTLVFCTAKAKLLQFHENERPPYWGTWSKKSKVVGPRRPFAKDCHYFEYEYDSDDDWEEEEEGESLSDEEKDKEEDQDVKEEDDDEDDGFFVGHGILDKEEAHLLDSDEEQDASDNRKAGSTTEKDKSTLEEDLELQKMKLRAEQFEEEYKKQKNVPVKLKSRVFGCFWNNSPNYSGDYAETAGKDKIVHDQLLKILQRYRSVLWVSDNEDLSADEHTPIGTSQTINIRVKQSPSSTTSNISATPKVGDNSETPNSQGTKKTPGRQKAKFFPEESIPDLIRLVHGNSYNKMFLTREFSAFLQNSTKSESKDGDKVEPSPCHDDGHEDDSKEVEVPKTKIISKIQEIAEYKRWTDSGPMANRMCWIVKPEVLADPKWQQFDFRISEDRPNTWKYILEQPKCTGPGKTPSTNDVGGRDSGDKSNSASPSNTPKRKTADISTERDRNLEKPGKSPAPHSLITKFAKILTPEERMQQMTKLREKAEAEREAANSKVQEKIAAVTKELVDSNSSFTIGDLVWGTIKGFPAWPGKIVLPPDDLKRPGIKKLLHCVKFFGTYDFGWLSEQDVKPYHIFRDTLVGGSKTHGFLKAVKEIEEFSLGKNMINAITEPVSIRPESAAPVQEEMNSPMITNGS